MVRAIIMKRGRGDSDEEYEEGGFASKKMRVASSTNPDDQFQAKLIRRGIVRVGDAGVCDTPKGYRDSVENVIGHIEAHENAIVDLILQCVVELPTKTISYCIFAALLNNKKPFFGKKLVSRLQEELSLSLEDGLRRKAKLLMRFLVSLSNVNVVDPVDVANLFRSFIQSISVGDEPQNHLDSLVYIYMSALPWCGTVLLKHAPGELSIIMEKLGGYVEVRSVTALPTASIRGRLEKDMRKEDVIETLYEALLNLQENKWISQSIPEVEADILEELNSSAVQEVVSIDIPIYRDNVQYPTLGNSFTLFDDYGGPEAIPISPSDRFIIQDIVRDHLIFFFPEGKEAAKRLASLNVKAPKERLIVEAIFGCILELPSASLKEVYFSVVLVALCKLDTAFPPALAKGFTILFEESNNLDPCIIDRFTKAFTFHISNFNWKWPWSKWGSVLDTNVEDSKRLVVSDILQRCEWLTSIDNLSGTLPPDFRVFLPPPAKHNNPFDDVMNKSSINAAFEGIYRQMTKDRPGDEIYDSLTHDYPLLLNERPDAYPVVVTAALLICGSKYMSAQRSKMSQYISLLRKTIVSSNDKLATLQTITSVWGLAPQMVIWTIGKLQAIHILDVPSIISWLFSPEVASQFSRFYIWDVLDDTLHRLISSEETVLADISKVEAEEDKDFEKAVMLEKKLNDLRGQLKDSFVLLLRSFRKVLNAHLASSGDREEDYNTLWFRSTVGRLRSIGRDYRKHLWNARDLLLPLKLGSDNDERVEAVWSEVEAMYV